MSTTTQTTTAPAAAVPIAAGGWRLDPARSSVAIHVPQSRRSRGVERRAGQAEQRSGLLRMAATRELTRHDDH